MTVLPSIYIDRKLTGPLPPDQCAVIVMSSHDGAKTFGISKVILCRFPELQFRTLQAEKLLRYPGVLDAVQPVNVRSYQFSDVTTIQCEFTFALGAFEKINTSKLIHAVSRELNNPSSAA